MPNSPIEVVALIVAHNGRQYLGECLRSVLDSADGAIARTIVVVDNGSTDGTADYLQAEFPQVSCVAAP